MASPTRARRRGVLAVGVALLLGALWLARVPLLSGIGGALVAEDPLAPVQVIVVSTANARANALEAAALYHDAVAPRLAVLTWRHDAIDDELDRRAVHYPSPTDLAVMILEHSGVPREAVEVVPGKVDGTNTELSAIAAYARRERLSSLVYLTARSHTARARWRLRRELEPATRISVRSSRWDPFAAAGWWRSRGPSREVMSEYLRWVNTFLLGDRWRDGDAAEPASP
jgi:uncharacterized SAM-binding protein YcdF (DUF218 family)